MIPKTIHSTLRPFRPWPETPIVPVLVLVVALLGARAAQADIQLVQTTSNTALNTTAISATYVAPPAAGNLLVAIAGNRDASDPPTTPTGWTLLENGVGNSPGQAFYYKIAGAAEPSTVSLNGFSGASNRGLHIYEYSGVDTASPLDTSGQSDGGGTSASTGNITTGSDGALIAVGVTTRASSSFDGWSGGFGEQHDFVNGGTASTRATYGGAHLIAGAAGTYSTTANTTGNWMLQLAVFNAAPLDYAVTSTGDSGVGSLRAAIDHANLNPGTTISFDIPDTDPGYQTDGTDHWWRISPDAALPTITADGTIIDGSSQTANRGDVNSRGPEIEIHGGSAGTVHGLHVTGGSSTFNDLVVSGFNGNQMAAFHLDGAGSDGNVVTGCYIGTDALGTAALANDTGIRLAGGAANSRIGGSIVAERNLISGNGRAGVLITDAGTDGNVVAGNFIGTDVSGNIALANGADGVSILSNATNSIVGGTATGAGNIISGNGNAGIYVTGAGATGTVIQGNIIGLDAAGDALLGNGNDGIILEAATGVQVGGTVAGAGNVISGNLDPGNVADGIWITGGDSHVIQGNLFGTDQSGTLARGNFNAGITLTNSSNNLIGGTDPGAGNVIAHNGNFGVNLQSSGSGNSILGNAIHGAGGLGIDFYSNGVTGNDAGDGDGGINEQRNFPVITAATANAGFLDVDFELDVPMGDYRVEFFRNPAGVDATHGEGEEFASAVLVSHGGTGAESFSHRFAGVAEDVLTATTTDSIPAGGYGNTSEFSAWHTAVQAPVSALPDPQGGAGADRYATEVVALGPLSYWRLGETAGATAVDEMGANNGTYMGPTLGAGGSLVGDADPAADFDGINDYVATGTFDVAGPGLTLSAWVNLASAANDQARFVSKATSISENAHTWMLSTYRVGGGDLRLRGRIMSGGVTNTLIASSGHLELDRWYFAVLTYDGSDMLLYLDGVRVGSLAHSVGGPVDAAPTVANWIGGNSPDPTVMALDGRLDEVAIFERALTVGEVRALHAAGRQYYTVAPGMTLAVGPLAGALINDTDPDGDALTVSLVSGPGQAAAFSLNSDGSFQYTASALFAGTDSFVYQACDGGSDCATATVTITAGVATYQLSGRVFEDDDFAGTGTDWDGGVGDAAQPGVDVELYTALDGYLASATTDASGMFSFPAVGDGSYKVRVRAATLGDADTPPADGLNPTVPATWPYPLPEMTWGGDAPLVGGQDATVDDAATGDDAGPGDNWVPVDITGTDVTGVNFGFCYDLIVNADDDANADIARSKQGSLRQFIKNSNAIVGTSRSWFQIP